MVWKLFSLISKLGRNLYIIVHPSVIKTVHAFHLILQEQDLEGAPDLILYKCYPTYRLEKTTHDSNLASNPLENLVILQNLTNQALTDIGKYNMSSTKTIAIVHI